MHGVARTQTRICFTEEGLGDRGRKASQMQGGRAQHIRGLPQPIAETTALDYSWSR